MAEFGPYIVGMVFSGLIGMAIGSNRTIGAGPGFFVGMLFGPIGWIIALVSAKKPEPSTLDRIERQPDEAGWHPDPLGRFDSRWYDGGRWTQHVGRVAPDGTRTQFEDPL
jgi:hypothetical protein